MAINIQDIQNNSPQVFVDGEISTSSPESLKDSTNAMIVGPAEKGPFFVPKIFRNPEQFRNVFGEPKTYSTYSAIEVLKQTDRVKFIRVGSTGSWNPVPIVISTAAGSDFPHFESSSTQNILSILILDDKYQRTENADPEKTKIVKSTDTTPKTASNFTLITKDEEGKKLDEWEVSFNQFSPKYIKKVLPPKVRVYQNFKETQQKVVEDVKNRYVNLQIFSKDSPSNPLKIDSLEAPRTPWVLSQDKSKSQSTDLRHRLFKVWIRSGGENQNQKYKISIVNIGNQTTESGYPTFTLRVRDFEDTDLNQNIIEEFSELSLNPEDDRYIERIIGTKYQKYNDDTSRIDDFGVFDKNSHIIRIEPSSEISKADKNTVPYGFETYKQTFTQSSQVPLYRKEKNFPNRLLDYKQKTNGVSERGKSIRKNLHLGIEFRIDQNKNFFRSIPKGAEKVGSPFKLDEYLSLNESSPSERKFTFAFQGGSDAQSVYREKFTGEDITTKNTFGFSFDGKFSEGNQAYKKAFDLLRDSQGGYSFNLLTTPELDIQNHERTVRNGEQLVRERGDAFYVFDTFKKADSPSFIKSYNFNIKSTYAATYYGWVETVSESFEYVPPSSVIPQLYARNDILQDPWFAPSGPNRGLIPDSKDVFTRISQKNLDNLYSNSINAITYDDPNGVLVYGNKCFTDNLYKETSNINIRRTLVYITTESKKVARKYLFEQSATNDQLQSEISSLLKTVQTKQGIKDYEVEIISMPENNDNSVELLIGVVPTTLNDYIYIEFDIKV